jgi:lipid-binding SYLF domain-containing protein
MKRALLLFIFALLVLPPGTAPPAAADTGQLKDESQDLVQGSDATLDSFMKDREFTWFHENLSKAKALLIFPKVIKAGFFWGGSGGNGVLVVRDERTGEWSQPAFYSIGSVSFGLQIGAEDAGVIMFAMSRKAIDSLYVSSFKFGGETSVAAGPRGLGAKKVLTADFISFAKARGLYAGLELEGSGIMVRDDLNRAYYGKQLRPIQIILERNVSNEHSRTLLEALKKAVT